jgi:hypothetical protein
MPPAAMKARQFLFACEDRALAALPAGLAPPERRVMWTILQLHYGDPAVHFELQPQVSRGLVELGLHFEGPVERNDAWAALVASHADSLQPALGPEWELEAWTASWRRLHRVFRFERLTSALMEDVASELASAITVLGPLVAESPLAALPAAAAPAPAPARRPRRRR